MVKKYKVESDNSCTGILLFVLMIIIVVVIVGVTDNLCSKCRTKQSSKYSSCAGFENFKADVKSCQASTPCLTTSGKCLPKSAAGCPGCTTVTIGCPKDCSGNGTCNTTTGVCACNTGYTGLDCLACDKGYHNDNGNCVETKSCPKDCSGNGTCNATTGACACNTGYTGLDCSNRVCSTGANGPSCPTCKEDTCGQCIDKSGYCYKKQNGKCPTGTTECCTVQSI